MSGVMRKIKKRANNFNTALKSLEKQLSLLKDNDDSEVSNEGIGSSSLSEFQKFDLKSIISYDLYQNQEEKRKQRNKRKSKNRKNKK